MKLYQLPIIIILLLSITHGVSANTGAYETFKEGLELEQELRIFEARDTFREAIIMDPSTPGYLDHYGWFLHIHGFSEEAVAVFKKALPLAEDKPSMTAGLAWNLKIIGLHKPSQTPYRLIDKSEATGPKPAMISKKTSSSTNDQYLEKIRELNLEIIESPYSLTLQKKLFNVYIEHNELDNAIQTAEDLRSSNELDKITHLQLSRILLWNGNKDQSEIEYRELIKGSPNSAFLHYELAGILEVNGKLDEALKTLEKSLNIYPDAAVTKRRYAEVLAQLGKGDEAVKTASSIDTAESSRLSGLLAIARALHFSERLTEAQGAYQTVLNEYPYNTDALWGMSKISIDTGKYKSARATIAKWEEAGPGPRLEKQKELLASSSPVLEVQAEHYTNSSNYTRNNYGADYSFSTRPELRLKTGYYHSDFSQDGFSDVSRDTLFIHAKNPLSGKAQLSGRLALKKYDNGNNTNVNGNIELQYKHSNKLTSVISFRHFDIIDTVLSFNNTLNSYVVTIGSVGLDIQSDDYKLYLTYGLAPRVSLSGEIVYGKYSDGNTKNSLWFDATYQVRLKPDIRIAYNYFHLDFKNPAITFTEGTQSEGAYWDPINFDAHTLRLEYRDDYNKRLSYGAKIAVSYSPKSQGTSEALSIFGTYRIRDQLSLRLDARWFDSNKGIDRAGTEEGPWWASNYNISLQYMF